MIFSTPASPVHPTYRSVESDAAGVGVEVGVGVRVGVGVAVDVGLGVGLGGGVCEGLGDGLTAVTAMTDGAKDKQQHKAAKRATALSSDLMWNAPYVIEGIAPYSHSIAPERTLCASSFAAYKCQMDVAGKFSPGTWNIPVVRA